MVTPNTLETTIEYTFISSILDKICELTKKTFGIFKKSHLAKPLKHLLEIKTWGIEWKREIEKTNEWVTC